MSQRRQCLPFLCLKNNIPFTKFIINWVRCVCVWRYTIYPVQFCNQKYSHLFEISYVYNKRLTSYKQLITLQYDVHNLVIYIQVKCIKANAHSKSDKKQPVYPHQGLPHLQFTSVNAHLFQCVQHLSVYNIFQH